MATAKAAALIWINGFPGTGKLTVARAITQLHKDTILLDNHKLIDPVEIHTPRSHPDYQKQRRMQRQSAFEQYVFNPASLSKVVIFTGQFIDILDAKSCEGYDAVLLTLCSDFQSDNDLGRSVAAEFKEAAERGDRPFIPIYLTCDLAVNLKRVRGSERVDSGTGKIVDQDLIHSLRDTCELARLEHAPGLTLDSTDTSPSDIAACIVAFNGMVETDQLSARQPLP